MKSERGFALIAALWLIATLSVLVGGEMAVATLGQKATVNRIVLTRSRWAAEACLAIVQSRWRQRRLADGDTIDLGRDTRCNWQIEDPGSRININAADPDLLLRALADTTLVSDLLAERRSAPFRSLAQLAPEIRPVLTVDGPGTINVNAASRRVLSSLPGLTAEAVTRILDRRAIGRPIGGLDELSGLLSPPARAVLLERYADLARIVTFAPAQLVITSEGSVGHYAARSRIEIVVVPLSERLAVTRRRMW